MSVTFRLHAADRQRCNANLTLGATYTLAEARHRIKQWCVEGLRIDNVPGGRYRHMLIKPRGFAAGGLLPEADLDRMAAEVGP